LASSREVIFLVAGADKATAVAGAFRAPRSGTPKWPASLVHSTGTVRWFVDRTAAAALPSGIRTSSDR
jgi:6-phosphogluconolactonase/glucosamine-6-phosphate isomerase/deaminase